MRLRSQSARTLLYEEVVEELYRLIDEKHIQPGGKLPPERELIEQLKVSRNVLREAFHVLETRGVIGFPPGKRKILKRTARPWLRETYRKSQQKSGTLFHAGSV